MDLVNKAGPRHAGKISPWLAWHSVGQAHQWLNISASGFDSFSLACRTRLVSREGGHRSRDQGRFSIMRHFDADAMGIFWKIPARVEHTAGRLQKRGTEESFFVHQAAFSQQSVVTSVCFQNCSIVPTLP